MAEQQRIAAVLDEALEGIATAKAKAEKNLQNARALFESYLDAAIPQHGGDCVETSLGEEVDLLSGFAFPSAGYTDAAESVRLLRGDNIMQGYLRWDEAKHWPTLGCATYARFALQEGDAVLAMDRPWVKAGLKRAQISADDLPCLLVQRTARLRAKERLRKDFLSHLIGSRSFSRHLLEVQTGIGVPHFSGKQIESFRFMRPPIGEQELIAGVLDQLHQSTQRIAGIYERKLAALDELKKSLLHQAFSGALESGKLRGHMGHMKLTRGRLKATLRKHRTVEAQPIERSGEAMSPVAHSRLAENKVATVSLLIGAAKEAGLVKPDQSDSNSTRYARYLPFWARGALTQTCRSTWCVEIHL